jgi:poly(3-hydroxybutyrate) depolymerase
MLTAHARIYVLASFVAGAAACAPPAQNERQQPEAPVETSAPAHEAQSPKEQTATVMEPDATQPAPLPQQEQAQEESAAVSIDVCAAWANNAAQFACAPSGSPYVCNCTSRVGNRQFVMSAPAVQSDAALDVVYMFHGFSWNGASFRNVYQTFEARAQRPTWFIYPTGTQIANPAGSGAAGSGWLVDADGADVALIDQIDAALNAEHTISRRFAFGRSYGGFFVHGLVAARPALLAGIATVVSAIIPGQPGTATVLAASEAVPAWFGYNLDDPTILPAWTQQTIEAYRARNGCGAATTINNVTRFDGCAFETVAVSSFGQHVPSEAMNTAALDFLFNR